MIKKLLRVLFVFVVSNSMFAQQTDDKIPSEKKNPIIFAEAFGGPSAMEHAGFAGGFELNYQYKKSLFSVRYIHATGYKKRDSVFSFYNVEDNDEFTLLYGKRWSTVNRSFSVSTGISHNNLILTKRDEDFNRHLSYDTFYGVPFEASFKWFYPKKRSHLIYNTLIPSIGMKLFGNISKRSYVGIGFSFGFGLSKEY